ncbi:MAG TPA: hypothetical protein PLD55_12445 [bacterium]|nr:hypothetical protein [bacterium]
MLERLTENQIKALIEGLWLSKEQLSELGFDNDWIRNINAKNVYLKIETDFINEFYYFSLGSSQENDDICNCDYDPIDNDELIDNLLNKRLI